MASNAAQIGSVDKELVLGDSHWNDVGDVVVRDSIAIAAPVNETINTADAIDDASGVVGVGGQRN